MNQPKVSVIIPVYNTEQYLRQCLDSVVNQTLKDIEIICVDDGSTDGSLSILREYEAKDSRVKVLTQQNQFAGAARNNGLLHACGEYCIFLDADDFFEPNLLEKSYKKALADKADIVAFHFYRYYENGTLEERKGVHREHITRGDIFNYQDCPDFIMSVVNPTPWNKLYRTDFIRDHDLKFEEISSSNDITFASVSVAVAERVSILDERLVYYRVGHSGTITSIKSKNLKNVLIAVKSGVAQVSKLPYYDIIQNSAMRFAIENIVYAFRFNISDFGDPVACKFYEDVKAFCNTPLFNNCSESTLHSKTLYNYFRCIRDNDYLELVLMLANDEVVKKRNKAIQNSLLKSLVCNPIYVSLTSYPARIHSVCHVITSIKNQTVSADKIMLWLAEEEFPDGLESLPVELQSAVDDCFEIRWCRDLKSHKKYYQAMHEYPEAIIITVDDDICYENDLIEKLIRSYVKFPYAVSAMRAHLITFDNDRTIAPYAEWEQENKTVGVPSYCLFATSGAGTLFPPHCMHSELFNIDAIQSLCLYADDLWLKAMQILNGTPVVIAGNPVSLKYVKGTQESGLWHSNVCDGRNDEQLTRILEKYDSFLGEKDTITHRIWLSSLSVKDIKPSKSNQKNNRRGADAIRASKSAYNERTIDLLSNIVRGGIQCYRDNGLGYTIRRCLYHLGLWEDEENPGYKKRPLLRRFADCYAEHGLRYTAWRVLVYLHLSKDN